MLCTARKTIFSFSKFFERWSFQKNRTGIWSFLHYQERWFFFPENMILFFRHKTKDDLSQKKNLEIWYFLQMFWKDSLSKKLAPEHDLFCNIWKDGIFFSQKIYFSFRRKMKEDDLYQKTSGNMIFSVYMRRR